MDSCHITLYDELKYLRESIKILAVLMMRLFARMDSRILAEFMTLHNVFSGVYMNVTKHNG